MRIGTRGSRLARWQAEWLRARLGERGVATELVVIETQGDAVRDRPLHDLEGTGFFTKEIEDALLAGRIDVAVHSLKDLPTALPPGLELAAVPARADPAEALVSAGGRFRGLADLPPGARVGTSSLRRIAQLRYARPDVELVPLRGNVPTRVAKVVDRGELDAALLARAGLERLDLFASVAVALDPLEMMPAPGQGALALEIRAHDAAAAAALAPLAHGPSADASAAERAVLSGLGGGCQAPVAAYCEGEGGRGKGRLYGRVTAADGSVQLTASALFGPAGALAAGAEVARLLRAAGAERLLAR